MTDHWESNAVRSVVGGNLAYLRARHDLTADDVARAMRFFGFKWTASRVRRIEQAERPIGIAELVALGAALSARTATDVTPSRLLQTSGRIQLGEGQSVPGSVFVEALLGARQITPADLGMSAPTPERIVGAINQSVARFKAETGTDDYELMEYMDNGPGLALSDKRAAKRLGVSEGRFYGLTWGLWRKLLSEKVQETVPADASPQAKGHATRELVKELEAELQRGDD